MDIRNTLALLKNSFITDVNGESFARSTPLNASCIVAAILLIKPGCDLISADKRKCDPTISKISPTSIIKKITFISFLKNSHSFLYSSIMYFIICLPFLCKARDASAPPAFTYNYSSESPFLLLFAIIFSATFAGHCSYLSNHILKYPCP